MFGDIIQPTHLLFVLVVALLVLGPKRLPEVGRSLGKGIRDFRQGIQGVQEEAQSVFHHVTGEPEDPKPGPELTGQVSPPTVVHDVSPVAVAEPVASAASVSPTSTGATVTAPARPEPDPADYAD
jgi:sec-independent protein translocase protein TatA